MWSVFRVEPGRLGDDRAAAATQAARVPRRAGRQGRRRPRCVRPGRHARRRRLHGLVARRQRRGAAGRLRRPAPHAPRSAGPACRCGARSALHRPAEFNKSHVPAFLAGEEPQALRLRVPVRALATSGTCCPTRSAGRCSPTTARRPAATPTCGPTRCPSFALGDYEWILAFEADELHRIVDLMRDLRATEARRHVREEIPFFTGPRVAARRPGRHAAVATGYDSSVRARRDRVDVRAVLRDRDVLRPDAQDAPRREHERDGHDRVAGDDHRHHLQRRRVVHRIIPSARGQPGANTTCATAWPPESVRCVTSVFFTVDPPSPDLGT